MMPWGDERGEETGPENANLAPSEWKTWLTLVHSLIFNSYVHVINFSALFENPVFHSFYNI
jgi:hypothetical protein